MEQNPLISVIVPVYNVEAWLPRCVDSILSQTYENLEILLVDDGSTDDSGLICEEYAKKDTRIRVIHKENGGLSSARNSGLDAASGEYIGFVDSDDWIEPRMYQRLGEAITGTDSDIASCGARRVWADERPDQDLCGGSRDGILDGDDAMKALITTDGLVQTVWNKLYRSDIAKAVSFPVGQLYEDEFWSWRVFALAKRVVTVEGSYYNYLQRDSGIMGMGFSAKSVSVIGAKTDRQKYIEEHRPGLTDIGRADIAYSCMHMGVQVLKSMGRKEASQSMKYLRGVVKQYPVSKAYLYSLPKKKGLHLILIQKLFRLICLLHSV